MPTIKLLSKKKTEHKGSENKDTRQIYSSRRWRTLRNAYFMDHPICEMCLKEYEEQKIDHVNPTEEIHHIKAILKGKDKLEMDSIAYNPNNLMALCKYHHHTIHKLLHKL